MEISAGFIIFLILVSPFVLWIISFFTGVVISVVKLIRGQLKKRDDGRPAMPP